LKQHLVRNEYSIILALVGMQFRGGQIVDLVLTTLKARSWTLKCCSEEPQFRNIVSGVYVPVLAKHSKNFSLEDSLAIGGAHRKYLRTAKLQASPLNEIAIVPALASGSRSGKHRLCFGLANNGKRREYFLTDPPVNCLSFQLATDEYWWF
jgi:hypothetical protein